MTLRDFFIRSLVSGALLGAAATSQAQALRPDSAARPARLLLKAGLRLTHLHYARDNRQWQLLVPLSLGAEYRLASRVSLYALLEADVQATSNAAAPRRRGSAATNALPAATLGLGSRYYYGPAGATRRGLGNYLALEANADWAQLGLRTTRRASQRRLPTVLTPALYAFWGTQHRPRPHLLYDLNAGLGVLAPAYYSFERVRAANHWDVGAQVNIRFYLGF